MKHLFIYFKTVIILSLLLVPSLQAQKKNDDNKLSKPTFSFFLDRTGIMTGNLIRSAYSNYGNLGSRTLKEARMEWPVGSGVTYGFEFIFFAASEVITDNGDTIHIITDRYSGGARDVPNPETHNWGWEPLPGYFNDGDITRGINEDINNNGILDPGEDLNNNGVLDLNLINKVEYPAMSNRPETWPFDWPDSSFVGKPGTRRNKWNGLFGAFVRADQESYYVMDDRSNDEFPYFPFPENRKPFLEGGRRGVGLQVEVRNFQWDNPLAEDILITIYRLTNVSDRPLNKNIVGMYVDSDVGQGDAEDDASSFDTVDDITYQWDLNGLDLQGRKTGYFGFAFLLSPGNDHDGIDNDGDGMIDESQHDGIDNNHNWKTFTDVNGNGVWDTGERLNDDTGTDGLVPFEPGYTGPDPDGTQGNGKPDLGEPNFEFTDNAEIDQIGLTSFFSGGTGGSFVPRNDEDYWQTKILPGIFTTAASGFDIAFSYGSGFFDIQPHESQSYAIASLFGNNFDDILRNKRTMQRIYDANFDFVKPPLTPTLKAVAGDHKVYLLWDDASEHSRDPIYGKDFEMYKIYRSTDPFFNSIKTISDAFGNPVLWKPIAQFDLKDGLYGPHPIPLEGLGVSYDMGTDSGLRHSFVDTLVDNGRTYYYAVVGVDQGYDTDFFKRGISAIPNLEPISPSETSKKIEVDILGNVISQDKNVAVVVPREPAAGNQPPIIVNSIKHVTGNATGSFRVSIADPENVKNIDYKVSFVDDSTLQHLTKEFTILNQATGEILLTGSNNLFNSSELEKKEIDGLKFSFDNDELANINSIQLTGSTNLDVKINDSPQFKVPIDFEIRFFDEIVDTSYAQFARFRIPVNFQVWNATDNVKMEFQFVEPDTIQENKNKISPGDVLTLIAKRQGFNISTTWRLEFSITKGLTPIFPEGGDIIRVQTNKPFSSEDVYKFSSAGWTTIKKQNESLLDNIFVVPDPYVGVNSLERKRSSALSGRGERRVDFVNLPKQSTIRIYTVSGKLVKVIEHNASQDNGRESWDLTSTDGLEVAYGIYFFYVNAPGIGQKVGRFAIIK